MNASRFQILSGSCLCLAGGAYLLDTALDAAFPLASPGLGALVPVFGLIGFTGFWKSLENEGQGVFGLLTYALAMAGLSGLAIVTFLFNRLAPDLSPDALGAVLNAVRTELMVIGAIFLISAVLVCIVAWKADPAKRTGALAYAIGAIPVALPPLFPEPIVTVGGISVSLGLLVWGASLLAGAKGMKHNSSSLNA